MYPHVPEQIIETLASALRSMGLAADQALETLAALAPVTFKYKADDEAHVGFIAEDVPDLVATKDRKGLSAMDIVAVLAKVVQEQQAQIERLKAEVEAGLANR